MDVWRNLPRAGVRARRQLNHPEMSPKQESPDRSAVMADNSQPDYSAVPIPAKPPTEYSYVERRADLLKQIYNLGSPSMINQTEAADRYGVSQPQISKDLSRLGEHIDAELGSRRALATDAVFKRAIRGLLEEGDYRDAARTVKDWNEWLTEYQDLRELEARIEAVEARRDGKGGRL